MLIAPPPANEQARLRLLRRLNVLDTPPEEVFDRVTRVVAEMLQLPIALVSLVDENRQWFKSKVGLEACETSRDLAFCAHALHVPDVLVVEDASADPRFFDNPLVTGPLHIRFYAGVPLRSDDGLVLGTLCAIDSRPRHLSPTAAAALRDMAAIVQQELMQRAVTRDLHSVWQDERQARALSETRFATIFQQTPTGKAVVGLDGRFIAVNPKLCQIVGYDAEELMSKTFGEITHPDDLAEDLQLVADLLAGRIERYTLEKRYLHKDGAPVWVEIYVVLVRTETRQPDHFIAVVLDISERKHNQALIERHQEELENKVRERTQQLSRSRETLQVITDNLPVMIAQVDRDLRYLFNNDVYRQVFGIDPSTLRGQKLSSVLEPALFAELLPYFNKALAGERAVHDHLRYSNDQARIWCATYIPEVRNGEVVGFFVMSQDVTERTHIERMLHDKAMRDPLTDLPNRRALHEHLYLMTAAPLASAFALFFLDLDGFKTVNDSQGHEAGDELLRQVAARLKNTTRKEDFIGRLAGDEFVVVAAGISSKETAQRIAEDLCQTIATAFTVIGQSVRIGVSIGITLSPAGSSLSSDAVLNQADGAMYEAKRRGRNGYWFASLPSLQQA
ncbi:PAS domain S-box protein [Pseudomonas sp. dw_358]|uniref:PAS domain S-box protein n=1 Tax=Pseudomonas sp. dw_358 TaxID=2720083 RepID=UPI001BD2DD68|nr:PAS domain S-box protein [Pseudomonas sp. dw_358]